MRHRFPQWITALLLTASAASAQDGAPPRISVPAARVLQFPQHLSLSDAQIRKLEALEKAQSGTMGKAIAAYLRAEADFLDAARGEDLVVRRVTLERRAKTAIEGEMARLKAERETRLVLTAAQAETYRSLAAPPAASVWEAITAPSRIGLVAEAPADSGEVRISVTPVFADIYVDDVKVGTGRRFAMLPVGSHQIKLHAVGCAVAEFTVAVVKGVPAILTHTLTCGKS